MTEASGRVSGSWQETEGRRHSAQVARRPQARRQAPTWVPLASVAVLVWWPITFVLGLVGSGIWLLVVSMVLAVLAVPAIVVLLVNADRRPPPPPPARRRHSVRDF